MKEFRKVELVRMIQGEPTTFDFHFHAICLHSLLAIGHSLIVQSYAMGREAANHCHVDPSFIEAYVDELRQSFREWHHGFEDAEVVVAKRLIFGVEA